jgi:AraC-like DNA-binding protein
MQRAKTSDRRRLEIASVWTRAVGQIVTRAEHEGLERQHLLRRAELSEEELNDPDSRVPLVSVYALLEATVDLSGDPLMPLRMTRSFDFTSFDVLAFVVMTSATMRAGLRAMLKYQRLWSDAERYELREADGWGRLAYYPWGPTRRGHALMAEMFALDVVVNCGAMSGGPFDTPRVLLAHAAPADQDEHRALLGGVAAEFEQARNEVWIRSTDLDRRLSLEGREAVCEFFERHLDQRVLALPSASIAGRTRDLLTRGIASEPSVESLARRLRVSPRTLQRQLAKEGSSVRQLADEVRRARALTLLESGHSISEVAHLLGFAEPSAFHRAFRRWTGKTPEAFRRRL